MRLIPIVRFPRSLYLGYSAHCGVTLTLKYRYLIYNGARAPPNETPNAFGPIQVAAKRPIRLESDFNIPKNVYAR